MRALYLRRAPRQLQTAGMRADAGFDLMSEWKPFQNFQAPPQKVSRDQNAERDFQ
jgi:hypothetical protein